MPKIVTVAIKSREDTLPGLGTKSDAEVQQFVRNDFERSFNELGWDVLEVVSVTAAEPPRVRAIPRMIPRLFPREEPSLFPRPATEEEQRRAIEVARRQREGREGQMQAVPSGTEGFSYKIGTEPPPAAALGFTVDTEEKTTGLRFPKQVPAIDEDEAMRIVERDPRFKAHSAKRLV